MTLFITKRLAQAVLALLAVVTIVFLLGRVLGNPVDLLVPNTASRAEVERLTIQLGLDRPLVNQYFDYLADLARGDLGDSLVIKGYTIVEVLSPALWNSAKLAAFSMGLAIIIGLPLGIIAAVRRNTPYDYGARILALLGQVVPTWWLGIIMIVLFAVRWDLLPPAGIGGFSHYIMPGTVMALFVVAGIARLTRSSMLEVLDSEFIKLARAKGLPWSTVVWKHALRNALIPVVTFSGIFFAILVTSAIVIEVVFAWPGLGRVMFDALGRRDFPAMQGAILLGATIVISFNLVVDILYAWIDPRIRV
ncbi:ABC transporter permease [Dehalococcoidia bacterium]|nr:ABC transporter permease [Dehalococcoidia bacterium]